jgi:CO/xanthine dehydrogenase FAD-binding subunit
MEIKTYYIPQNLDDALEKFNQGSGNCLLGGGAWIKNTLHKIDTAIELSNLVSNEIKDAKNHIEIGAMTSLSDLVTNPLVNQIYDGILSKAAASIMGVALRNVATIGGSIVGKYAFSDLLTPLLAMDCLLVFHHQGEMKLSEYLDQTTRVKDILLKVIIDKVPAKGYFHKVARTSLDFSILNVAIIRHQFNFRICVGARPGIATCALKASDYLNHSKAIDSEIIRSAAKIACEELAFSSNFRAKADYRKLVCDTYISRGLMEVMEDEC